MQFDCVIYKGQKADSDDGNQKIITKDKESPFVCKLIPSGSRPTVLVQSYFSYFADYFKYFTVSDLGHVFLAQLHGTCAFLSIVELSIPILLKRYSQLTFLCSTEKHSSSFVRDVITRLCLRFQYLDDIWHHWNNRVLFQNHDQNRSSSQISSKFDILSSYISTMRGSYNGKQLLYFPVHLQIMLIL